MLFEDDRILLTDSFQFYAEGGGHLWLSVFLGGRYQDSIEIISHQIAWETWTLLPLTIRNLYGGKFHHPFS